MRAVSLFRSMMLAVLAVAGTTSAMAAPVSSPPAVPTYQVKTFSIARLHLGMPSDQVLQIVGNQVSPFSANHPRYDYAVSQVLGREFEPKTYLSKVSFVPDLPGGTRNVPAKGARDVEIVQPKPGIYTVDVYLSEIDPGNSREPVSVVTQIVARFTGDQTALNNNWHPEPQHRYDDPNVPNQRDYPNDTAMDLKLGIFVKSARDHYGAPSIDNTPIVGTPAWVSHCVVDSSRNYRDYRCQMVRYNWCTNLPRPGDMPGACGDGAYMTLNRNSTEVRLVDADPADVRDRVRSDDRQRPEHTPFDKVHP